MNPNIELTRSELHTHFIGMLSARKLLMMVSEYVDYIYWPLDKEFTTDSKLARVTDLLHNKEALDMLRVKHGEHVPYKNLDSFYDTRSAIMSYLLSILYLTGGKKHCNLHDLVLENYIYTDTGAMCDILSTPNLSDGAINILLLKEVLKFAREDMLINPTKKDQILKTLYNDYLNRVLKELVSMGCKYVEISFSNDKVISLLEVNPEISKKIKCKFLLSTGRDRTVGQMKQSVSTLKKYLFQGKIVGFDIMGEELALRDEEKVYSTTNKSYSFKRKLELLVDALKSTLNGVNSLRIHSGETRESFGNTEWILKTLLDIKMEYKKTHPNEKILPPPEVRIGHGLYFDRYNSDYILMLRELEAIIEINASSNRALSNIDGFSDIPYDFYLESAVPVVLSTDGHGLWDTNLRYEDYVAKMCSRYYDIIVAYDKEIIGRKSNR